MRWAFHPVPDTQSFLHVVYPPMWPSFLFVQLPLFRLSPLCLLPPPFMATMSLLAYPFHILGAIFRFIFQTLRIPIPNVPLSSLSFGGLFAALRAPPLDARTEAERWIRSVEEETGARCLSHASSTGFSSGAGEPGPSSLRQRGTTQNELVLPDFFVGAYGDALRTAQRELRIACVVLVSAEHDDDATFKRSVLCDPALVQMLEKENVLVWGGDVRGREAWSGTPLVP